MGRLAFIVSAKFPLQVPGSYSYVIGRTASEVHQARPRSLEMKREAESSHFRRSAEHCWMFVIVFTVFPVPSMSISWIKQSKNTTAIFALCICPPLFISWPMLLFHWRQFNLYFFTFYPLDIPVVEYACSKKGHLKIIIDSYPFNRSSAYDNTVYWNCISYTKTKYGCLLIITYLASEIILSYSLFSVVQQEFDPMYIRTKFNLLTSHIIINHQTRKVIEKEQQNRIQIRCNFSDAQLHALI